jgi:hypothetical protein
MNNRRDFLKTSIVGAGAYALTPYVNAIAANSSGNSFPRRFVFIRKSNGINPRDFTPTNLPHALEQKEKKQEAFEVPLDNYELPRSLRILDDYKEHMTILQGMSAKMCLGSHFVWQSIMGLLQSPKGNVNTLKRTSIDFELANLFPSPLGHVELSLASNRKGIVPGYSIPSPYQRNFCYADPITAYNNIFQCILNPSALTMDNDMFAYLQKQGEGKISSRRGEDKNSYRNHALSIEAIQNKNKELLKLASDVAQHMPDKDIIYKKGIQSATTLEKQEAMTEILASVLSSGLSNVVTYTLDDLLTLQTGIPGNETDIVNLHAIGHNQSYSGVTSRQIREKIRTHHIQQVKTIIDRLKAQPEGNGTMFDNTMVMYFPENGEKHHGSGVESPWLVMSGKNCNLDIAGRYIRMPHHGTVGHQTLGNWYTTLLNAHGNPLKHYGDLDTTMSRRKLSQEGAINRFIKA